MPDTFGTVADPYVIAVTPSWYSSPPPMPETSAYSSDPLPMQYLVLTSVVDHLVASQEHFAALVEADSAV